MATKSRATKQKLRESARRRFVDVVIPRRDAKRLLERRLRAIRDEIAALKKRSRLELAKIRHGCRGSARRARARAKARRVELLEQARKERAELLLAAKNACTRRLSKSERSAMTAAERLRDEAERRRNRYLQEWGRKSATSERSHRSADKAAIARRMARERQEESDAEVERNLSPELLPAWRFVKKRFKATPAMSRTEAFEHWAHDNPQELEALLAEHADDAWRDDLRQRERLEKALTKIYRAKGAVRGEDLEALGITERDLEAAGLEGYLEAA